MTVCHATSRSEGVEPQRSAHTVRARPNVGRCRSPVIISIWSLGLGDGTEMPGFESGEVGGMILSRRAHRVMFDKEVDIRDVVLDPKKEVLLASYPRTGTTWMTQALTLLLSGEEGFDETSKTSLTDRTPFLEYDGKPGLADIQRLEEFSTPRVDKTHLTFPFAKQWVTRDKVKAVVLLRNPKDTLVSLYHFTQKLGFPGTWDEYVEMAKAGKQIYGHQTAWSLGWWENRHQGDMLFVYYEDMAEDLPKVLRGVADFLGQQVSEEFIAKVAQSSGFDEMKAKEKTLLGTSAKINNYLRSGKVGKWTEYFTEAQNEWFDEHYVRVMKEGGMRVILE